MREGKRRGFRDEQQSESNPGNKRGLNGGTRDLGVCRAIK